MDDDAVQVSVGGAPPGLGPVAIVEPLQDLGAIETAVNAIALADPASIIIMLEEMSARIHTLSMEQWFQWGVLHLVLALLLLL